MRSQSTTWASGTKDFWKCHEQAWLTIWKSRQIRRENILATSFQIHHRASHYLGSWISSCLMYLLQSSEAFSLSVSLFHWVNPQDTHPWWELGCENHARTLSPTPSSLSLHPCALAEVRDIVEVPEVVLVFAREVPALTRRCQRWSLIGELGVEVTDVFFPCQGGNERRRNLPLQKRIPLHILQRKREDGATLSLRLQLWLYRPLFS